MLPREKQRAGGLINKAPIGVYKSLLLTGYQNLWFKRLEKARDL
jgi:hypothetical protein